MKNSNLFCSDIKVFITNEVNRLFILVIIVNILLGIWNHFDIRTIKRTNLETSQALSAEIKLVKNRTDFRYFNLTRSLEEIHNIKIDTKNGEIKKKI